MTTDPYQSLLNSAFRFLSIRSRSRKEIEEYLHKKAQTKDIPIAIVSVVITRLEEMQYIDDNKFAQAYVTSALRGKPKGPSTIKFELKKKGVADTIIQSVIAAADEIQDEETQIALARKALGKKGERYKTLPILTCKRKVYDYLFRRGFTSSVVQHLVDDYCQKAYNKAQGNYNINTEEQ